MNIFDKWDKNIDTEGLQKDIAEADANGGGDYREVPVGTYEVRVDKIELKESSKGDPMVSIWFKILDGDYKGSLLFMNQVITQGFQIRQLNRLLKSMGTDCTVEFKNYSQYNNLLMDIYEVVESGMEYLLEYKRNKKDFPIYTIKEVYEVG